MIDDLLNNGMFVHCAYNDAIKVKGVYVPTPESDTLKHIEIADRLGYKVSTGICPDCTKKTLADYRKVRDLQYRLD